MQKQKILIETLTLLVYLEAILKERNELGENTSRIIDNFEKFVKEETTNA